jgi:hypothetical protein
LDDSGSPNPLIADANSDYPRTRTIESLIAALARFPSLGRQISESLTLIGEAMADTASPDEHAALLRGLLADEAQVRLACLQALMVSFEYCNLRRFMLTDVLAAFGSHGYGILQ